PTLTQTIAGLVAGQCYTLSGDYTSLLNNSSPPGAPSFSVAVGSAEWTYPPTPLLEWHHFSNSFTATSASMLLTLQAELDPTDNDFLVDNICIVPGRPTISTLPADLTVCEGAS